ncbi:Uncharacterised protein [Mycobacteroides abscessus subsp. abscessus]|nr:Uncharacterised protein [Mycobacteroides abscessus subsp. abscessus]
MESSCSPSILAISAMASAGGTFCLKTSGKMTEYRSAHALSIGESGRTARTRRSLQVRVVWVSSPWMRTRLASEVSMLLCGLFSGNRTVK